MSEGTHASDGDTEVIIRSVDASKYDSSATKNEEKMCVCMCNH